MVSSMLPLTSSGRSAGSYLRKCSVSNLKIENCSPRCNTTADLVPTAPAHTFLAPEIPAEDVKELGVLTYKCTQNGNKTYIPDNPKNEFNVTCLPGAVWEIVPDDQWAVCDDPTTTTAAPTTTQPPKSRFCSFHYPVYMKPKY